MILFLFTIVFIAQLIIAAAIIIKLIDLDLAIIELDEKLQAERAITKCSLYYLKEVVENYKVLVSLTFENFDKKFKKSKHEKIKSTVLYLSTAILPKPYRTFIKNSKWGYKIAKYLITP